MTAEIIAVGTELLMGSVVNTNAAFIARECAALGVSVFRHTTVGDNQKRIAAAFAEAYERGADVVIATGGLGPTSDDITKEAAAEFLGLPLVLHPPSWEAIEAYFRRVSPEGHTPSVNKKQAMLPQGCAVFPNARGTAPGVCVEKDGKLLILLPGPPSEMTPMFTEQAAPLLRARSDTTLASRVLRLVGIGESALEERIKPLLDAQTNPTLAMYAGAYEVWLRLTASANDKKTAEALNEPLAARLYEILGELVYGEGGDTLEGVTARLLRERGFTVALAESCTGGLVAARLVNCAGVSDVLREGVVTYANESKINRLGVDAALIEQYGAVSPQTAEAMAAGVAASARTDVGLSVTGIAGPDGGTTEKPVGLVFIGLFIKGRGVSVRRLSLSGARQTIRERAATAALDFLRLALLKYRHN